MGVKNRLKKIVVDVARSEKSEIRLRPIGYVLGVLFIFAWILILQSNIQIPLVGGLLWGQGNFVLIMLVGVAIYAAKDIAVSRISKRGDAKYVELQNERYYMIPVGDGPYLKETWFVLACKPDEEGLFRFYTGDTHESVVAQVKSGVSIINGLKETDTRTTIDALKARVGSRYSKIIAKMDPDMSRLLRLQMLVD